MSKTHPLTRTRKAKALELFRSGRLDEARAGLEKILRINRRDADVWQLLGTIHGIHGRLAEAESCLRQGLDIDPHDPLALNALGIVYVTRGRHREAHTCFEKAVRLKPDYFLALTNLGNTLATLGQADAAVDCYRRSLHVAPAETATWANLGTALTQIDRHLEAVEACGKAIALDSANPDGHHNLALALYPIGRLEEATQAMRRAVALRPDSSRGWGALLLILNYRPDVTPHMLWQEHRLWGERHGRTREELGLLPSPVPLAGRRLRVGYVSGDFREHSVAYFLEPILAHHDRDHVEVFCYSEFAHAKQDAVTARLQAFAEHWIDTQGLDDLALARRMREDGIDILVDLAGHTAGNRLLALAYRPAPVQVSYLGYVNTTGLPAMDYRLTDEWADPPGQEAFHTERLVRLPHGFLCYRPPDDAPEVALLPAQTAGYVTFGSFNMLPKTTPQVIALWARLLQTLPNARLVLKNKSLRDPGTAERCAALFAAQGIDSRRLELIGWLPSRQEHLGLYSRIDIGLDTFPYNGATTTCEALWMGVPVITLAGDRHAGRVGVSLLSRLGLSEFIADTPEDYVARAVALAQDRDALARLRAGLRERMAQSSLCDARAFTRALEEVYRACWHAWCGDRVES